MGLEFGKSKPLPGPMLNIIGRIKLVTMGFLKWVQNWIHFTKFIVFFMKNDFRNHERGV